MNLEFHLEILFSTCIKILVTVYSLLIAWVSVHGALFLVIVSGFYYKYISEFTLFSDNVASTTTYDYIIVGAGTAGLTIATSLNSSLYKILLIEAGGYSSDLLKIPFIAPALHSSKYYDWMYETTPQSGACLAMNDNQCKLTQGRGFGGSNILNNMIYYRGDPEDFRDWFPLEDGQDYDFQKQVEPFFKKFENDIEISDMKYTTPIGNKFSSSLSSSSSSKGKGIRFMPPKLMMKNGKRTLGTEQKLTNIHVLVNSQVTRLIFNEASQGKRVSGVMVNTRQHYHARNGVILSAGAIGTPKLLLKSGIGPCDELAELKIDCIKDVPGVGRNLQDHIATGLDLIVLNQTVGTKPSEILTPANLINYLHHGEGPLTSGGCEALGFDEETKGLGYMFLPVGLSTDRGFHLRKIMNIKPTVWKIYFQKFTETTTVSIIPIVLQPKSRGFLKLAKGQIDSDSDFNDEPIVSINPKYLQEQQDVEKLITGIQRLSAIIDDNLKSFGGKLNPLPLNECKGHSFGSRFYWECYIRQISFSVYHPVGTCRMGNKRQKDTVVDYHTFKVLGMENLYVCDSSVMRNLPSGNPNAAVGMLAKKFVDTLLDGEKLKKKWN